MCACVCVYGVLMLMNERAADDSQKKGSICARAIVSSQIASVAHLHFVCALCVSVYKTDGVCAMDSQNLYLVLAHTADQRSKGKIFTPRSELRLHLEVLIAGETLHIQLARLTLSTWYLLTPFSL